MKRHEANARINVQRCFVYNYRGPVVRELAAEISLGRLVVALRGNLLWGSWPRRTHSDWLVAALIITIMSHDALLLFVVHSGCGGVSLRCVMQLLVCFSRAIQGKSGWPLNESSSP